MGWWFVGLAAVAGPIWAGWWATRLIRRERSLLRLPSRTRKKEWSTWAATIIGAGLAEGLLIAAEWNGQSVRVDEVRPSELHWQLRLAFHLGLVAWMATATAIDFDCYCIPDAVTLSGAVLALLAAFASGELQIMHVWVDWSYEIPGLRGPYLPAWMDRYRNLHGVAWSLAGAAAGAGATAMVRAGAKLLLGMEAMGAGDVTLMAMIGAALGWQAALCGFLLAPLFGISFALGGHFLFGTRLVPYGPSLVAGAYATLLSWRWLWPNIRSLFGDPVGLAIVGGIGAAAFVILLGGIRLYRQLPGRVDKPPPRPPGAR